MPSRRGIVVYSHSAKAIKLKGGTVRNVKLKQIMHAAFLGIGAIWAGISQAAPAKPVGVKILEFGQYVVGGETRADAPGLEQSGQIHTRHLLQQTSCITAQRGTRFGLVIRHTASDTSLKIPMRIVVKHPPLTMPNGTIKTSDSWDKTLISEGLYTGWRFDTPNEMILGTWTFQVHYDGKVAAEKKFTVVREGSRCR